MSESVAMSEFCTQIRALIKASGLTVSAAAEKAGIDPGNFSRILNGKEKVTLERAERIANAFGATLSVKLKKIQRISAA
jgi:transcriptional regulator with XRE-family HTH domain